MGKAKLFKRYPVRNIVVYNATTVVHFLCGGLMLSGARSLMGTTANVVGLLYVLMSLIEMYILMPFQVCRNCVYSGMENGLCISGLNIVARRLSPKGNTSDFPNRAQGLFCPNNLYISSLLFPVLCGIPIVILNFSVTLLALELCLVILLFARFAFIIPKLACVHCMSKFICPQAGLMGVREK
jgi:hypothetical protein